jgi:hypothetical protein
VEHANAASDGLGPTCRCLTGTSTSYASLADLLSTFKRLRALGITPYWCIKHGPNRSFYYRDPDANQVELQIDVFDSPAAVDEFSGSDFGINPIGVKFNADELIRRFDAGEPEATLTARPRISPEEIFAQLPNN